ncbi:MAG TPA: response regulator transcription factor [Opitutaceae bacterium]|jgi:DNA-binding NarL/FixJ family response regulator
MLPRSERIRILLVDDHIIVRMGLATAAGGEPDMEVVGEADNGTDAIEVFRATRPDVVVLDLRMPGPSGTKTILRLREEFGDVRVLVFSNYASGDEALESFRAGAHGFVVKEMPLDLLLEAIRRIHRGEQYIPAEISRRMNGRMFSQLSNRELDVLKLIAKGLTNKEVGSQLGVVEGTVKIHVTNILAKLGVSDRTQAIVSAVKRGIIELD